jgi:hypothetical protein
VYGVGLRKAYASTMQWVLFITLSDALFNHGSNQRQG